jgi:O-antigen ligase
VETSPTAKLLGTHVIFTAIAVSVFVSPWNSIDPVNLPKLLVLGILGTIALGLTMSDLRFVKSKKSRILLVVLILFVTQLLLALIFSPDDFSFHFYGTPNRNTGFLAYLFLSFVLFASAASASIELLKKFAYSLMGVGAFLGLYGLGQWRGTDFFDYVNAYGSNVFGTFGNPNFQSAFMGITAAVSLTWATLSQLKLAQRMGFFALCFIAILNVYFSSEQGYLNFLAGFLAAVLVYLFTKKKLILAWTGLALSGLGGLLVMAGILNNGPLADLLYKSSLQARGFYWRAAINMMIERPFFGVGLDGFGNWYRRSRPQSAIEVNASVVSDTAHNIPLDIGSGGGIPLLTLYLMILGLALNAIVKVIKRSQDFDPIFASIVAAWVAYQAQSVISINQLGLGVWGWSLTGLLIGYELNTRGESSESQVKSSGKASKKKEQIPASVLLIAVATAAIGLAVSLPPYLAANKYYKALQSGDGNLLYESAYLKPYDRTRFLYTAQIMAENKLEDRAIQILSDASKLYPDSFEIWQRWAGIPSATPAQITKAKAEMKRLDPLNPEWK